MRKAYPSDITRKQFEHIHPLLESVSGDNYHITTQNGEPFIPTIKNGTKEEQMQA